MADQSNEMGMVAKVARAIDPHAFAVFDSFRDYCIRHGDTEEEALANAKWAHESGMDKAMAQARDAIEAMRTPTEAMIAAGAAEYEFTEDVVVNIYGAILDAALSHDEVKG